jgi:hypothetical protein
MNSARLVCRFGTLDGYPGVRDRKLQIAPLLRQVETVPHKQLRLELSHDAGQTIPPRREMKLEFPRFRAQLNDFPVLNALCG